MALQKVKDTMRTTTALDATKLANDSITLAHMASGTDGQVITYSAAGDPVAIGPGAAGEVLTSAGANLPQTFAEAAGGAWAVITNGSGTFSGVGSVTFSGFTKTTKIIIPDVVPSTATQIMGRVGTGAGPTIITSSNYDSDYYQHIDSNSGSGSGSESIGITALQLISNITARVTEPASIEIDLFVPENTTYHTHGRWVSSSANDVYNLRHERGTFSTRGITTAVTAFQIYPASGTITGSYIVLELN